jgi:hypothetical protein
MMTAVTLLLVGGCTQLPTVSAGDVRRLEGEGVAIVEQHKTTNPTGDWLDTYVLLEVFGPGQPMEVLEKVLRDNGWQIVKVGSDPASLSAYLPDSDLVLVDFGGFLERNSPSSTAEKFEQAHARLGGQLFVAILLPH